MTKPSVEELRRKHPGVKFYDPPRGGLKLMCPECRATGWLSPSLWESIKSYPHKLRCKCEGTVGPKDAIVVGVTGDPFLTIWDEEAL